MLSHSDRTLSTTENYTQFSHAISNKQLRRDEASLKNVPGEWTMLGRVYGMYFTNISCLDSFQRFMI